MQLKRNVQFTPHDKRCIFSAVTYIDQHYCEKVSADQLCVEVGLSKSKLQAGIRLITGLSLHNYILKVRIDKSKLLLEDTNQPVKSIATAMGFKRPSHYIFTFKEFTSLTPHAYRLQKVD
jgi:two-component system response regulator YesN